MNIYDFSILGNSLLSAMIYTIKLSSIVLFTMFVMNCLINTGIMKKVSNFLYPFTKHLKMNQLSLYSILSCFFSPTVGYSILAEGYNDKKVTEKELIGSSLANSFPSIFSHTFTFFIPIAIPLLGMTGVIYILIRSGVAMVKTIIGLFYLALVSKNMAEYEPKNEEKKNIKKSMKKSFESTLRVSKRILPIMFVTMFIVIYFSNLGVFEVIKLIINPVTGYLNLDPSVGILILTDLINVQAAMVMGSGLLENGVLSSKDVIIGLIFANVISLSTRYAKHSLPLHVSLFGPKLGTKIVMINASITFAIDILIIGAFLLLG
ncbi:nucleoside recognition domain-containing protein [Methanococcus maripaludis]|uniref:Nucleoside transporter/FeoB GTPase Gate domain-containing protein n=1 Tax=Methanococcus maripaludis TaxID=39152 RepID=A0A7J9RZB3_METMI|nr:nucleoside recognition domain-containing protein [Methanococcus maripaludis]MBB6067535.1 hypothetical protein [Methanococcus maripaludis]